MELKKILVVDDEVFMREATSASLKVCGFEVVKAKNGQEGLKMAASEQPDLIFLDYMMPDLDGLQVAVELGKNPVVAHIPIVMLSSKAEAPDIEKAKVVGIQHYLRKPIDPTELKLFLDKEFLEK